MNTTGTDVGTIPPIGRQEALALAEVEHGRILALLGDLDQSDWQLATECEGWTVKDVVAHLLGAAESTASLREFVHQVRLGLPAARRRRRAPIDGINDVQVRERAHLAPAQLVTRLEAALPRARARLAKMPGLIRKIPLDVPPIGRESVAYLHDRIANRDAWLHRVDLCRATGKQLELTPDHDGRLVADVVADWSQRHGQPFRLELSGPAGGIYAQGAGREEHHLDAVDFCRTLSGRTAGTGVLTHPLVF